MRRRIPFADVRCQIEQDGFPEAFRRLGLPFLPEDAAEWELMAAMVDYDPREALERIEVPVVALFGGKDDLVPVEASTRVYRQAVRPDLLTIAVFPGANHRLQANDPPVLVDGYLETLASFALGAVA